MGAGESTALLDVGETPTKGRDEKYSVRADDSTALLDVGETRTEGRKEKTLSGKMTRLHYSTWGKRRRRDAKKTLWGQVIKLHDSA